MSESTEEINEQDDKMQVAKTILEQLGGARFVRFTGAKNLVGGEDFLMFMLPRTPFYTKDGINKVKITLTPMDVYKMEFWKLPSTVEVAEMTTTDAVKAVLPDPIEVREDVYCDQLQQIFTKVTGLVTHL